MMNRYDDDDDDDDVVGCQSGSRQKTVSKKCGAGRTLWRNLAFLSDEYETTFHVWINQKNTDTSLRVHGLLIIGWLVGWIQSTVVLLFRKGTTGRALLVNIIQASVVIHEVMYIKNLLSPKIELQARQHVVKAKMHAFLHLATVSMVIICSQQLFHGTWHASSALFLTSLCIVDELPMYHLMRLHLVKLMCFEMLYFAEILIGKSDGDRVHQIVETLVFLTMGTLFPLGIAGILEYRKRMLFLHDLNERPTQLLGSFWRFFQWIGL